MSAPIRADLRLAVLGAGALLLGPGCGRARVAKPPPPDVAVEVLADWPGADAPQVEQTLAVPIEGALVAVPGVARVESRSEEGGVRVRAVFAPGTDPYAARAAVAARLPETSLPSGVTPSIAAPAAAGTAFTWRLSSDTLPLADLRALSDEVVRPSILAIPGIADIGGCGGPVREVHVDVDPARAAAMGVGLGEIAGALGESRNEPAGGLSVPATGGDLRVRGASSDAQWLGSLVLEERGGVPVALHDVASVEEGFATPRCEAFSGGHPVVAGTVRVALGTPLAPILAQARTHFADVGRRLPPGVRLSAWAPSDTVRLALAAAPSDTAAFAATVEQAVRPGPPAGDVLVTVARGSEAEVFVRAPPPGPKAPPPAGSALPSRIEAAVPGCHALLAGAPGIAVRVLGPDFEELNGLAASVRDAAAHEPGVEEAFVEGGGRAPRLEVHLDRERLARFGLAASDVDRVVTAATRGLRAATIEENGRQLDVVLRLAGMGADPGALASLPLSSASGTAVPLGEVADLRTEAVRSVITRRDGLRCLTVRARLAAAGQAEVAAHLQARLATAVPLPAGYLLTVDAGP